MEASAAGLAGGEGQAQGADGGAAEAQGPDVGALAQQLEAMQGSQEQMFQFLQQQPWLQQEGGEGAGEGEPAAEDFDLSFLDAESPQFDPSQVAERLSGLINQGVEQRVQAAMQPVQQQMNEERWNREAQELLGEFPDFGDPQKANEIVGLARQMVEVNNWPPDIANEPSFWRFAYLAHQGMERANDEGAESPEAAHLEGGGGARPGGQQVDLGDQIVNARRGRSALPFS